MTYDIMLNDTFTFVCDSLLYFVENSKLLHIGMIAFPLVILFCGIVSSIKGG